MRVVSEPASGSVTANAWSRSSPRAIGGSQRRRCSSLAWRRIVPITYIWACAGPALPPERFTSSRITDASVSDNPPPPYRRGISAESRPARVIAATNASG